MPTDTAPTDNSIDARLRLARDLCLGVGAFFVTPDGTVFSSFSDVMRPDDAEVRVAALARSSLTHPAARGSALFWSAEVAEAATASRPDYSLACVVAPVRDGEAWSGLLGVADVWLPELDDEQRSGLLALARLLATLPTTEPWAAEPSTAERAPQEPGPGAPLAGGRSTAPSRTAGAAAEPFLGEILDNVPGGLVVTRADGTIVLVNETFAALAGVAADTLLGEDVSSVLGPAPGDQAAPAAAAADGERARPPERISDALAVPEPGVSLTVAGSGGRGAAVTATGRRFDSRFAGECLVTLVRPTERRPAEGRTAEGRTAGPVEETGLQDLLDHVEDGIVCCDAGGTVVLANQAARRLQGLADDQLAVGSPFPAVTGLVTPEGEPITAEDHPLLRSMREDRSYLVQALLEEERPVHVAISARPLRVEGGNGAIAMLRDVTAEQEQQAHLTHYALHDPLTGVANRYLLIDALGRMLDGLARRGGFVSLIYMDLDRFKAINDEYGHDTGDEVLRAVAQRLERAVRGEDVVARIGGDEFVVAHVTADRLSDGDAVVARLRKVLTAPYRFGGLVLDVGASIGWVSASTGADTPESLITRADRAMYEHKNRHRAEVGAVAR